MNANILDLDILKPEERFLKLNGKNIDVSFVPTGITFDVDEITAELYKISTKEIQKNGEAAKKAYNLSVKLCSLFASHLYPEMNEEWFRDNTSAVQVNAFVHCIQDALIASYKGVAEYGKK